MVMDSQGRPLYRTGLALNKVDTKLMVLPKFKQGGWQERDRKETEQERRGTDVDMLEMA